MKFVKMHGSGNDYVYVDCFREQVETPEQLAITVSDRHKGIGSDGLVLIMPSDKADFRMRMFNADGSEAQMCGNASRCVGKYVYDFGLTGETSLTLETKAGIKRLQLFPNAEGKVDRVCVDMGEPILEAECIPADVSKLPEAGLKPTDRIIAVPAVFGTETLRITCVSVGNPHCISFIDNVDALDLEPIGRRVENAPLFPERINTEFVQILSRTHARMRVWERGSGETQACGTGACAVLVASVLNGLLDRTATLSLLGGNLCIEWRESDNRVYMTGDAVLVFQGEI